MKIYMAAPLFTTAERLFNELVGSELRVRGHEVYLPQDFPQTGQTAKSLFEALVWRVLNWADVVVANMDGPDPDSGTCWECGAAYKRVPVVAFRTDFRQIDDGFPPYNLMIAQSAAVSLDCRWMNTVGISVMINQALESLK